MPDMAKLAAYRAKRDFKATPEPDGSAAAAAASDGLAFVIQKHAASRLHYDLRLEFEGVMLSWAVAKGPSLVPGEKRLAVHVEDHPIAYNTFEGTIPKGQYGGGTVLIWDRGRWAPEQDPQRGMKKGHLDFSLDGEKLRGRFHLVRMKQRPGERQEVWLLIKSADEHAREAGDPDILDEEPRSVATGRTLEEIAEDRESAVWQSNREPKDEKASKPVRKGTWDEAARSAKAKVSSARERKSPRSAAKKAGAAEAEDPNGPPSADLATLVRGGTKAALPRTIEPCLATLVDAVPKGERWLHEIKWDGYRLLASKARGAARLATRRGLDWTARFPGIAEALAALPVDSIVLDGEAVIEDERGVPSFSALQNALSDQHRGIARDAILIAFDLLYLDGFDLRALPLEDRKARLAALVPAGQGGRLRLSEHIEGSGEAMLRSACEIGLEGVISKRRDRPYRSGRVDDWVKSKCTERQEFVAAGFLPSSVNAKAVGSLVLAYNEGGELRHAGRSGTGFSAEAARTIGKQLAAIRVKTPPFRQKLTADERRGVVWVEPRLVAEIEFRGWTGDNLLRHASFKGMRDDKDPSEVIRETAKRETAAPKPAASPVLARTGVIRSKNGGEVAGVPLTHPDRILWSSDGLTKQGLAEFYEEIATWLLPQVAGRPLSLVRCPSGVGESCFFQKHAWAGLSDHIGRRTIPDGDGEEEILFVEDIRGVIALVQASVLEIHPWGATIDDVERPDRIVMDLDPGEEVAWSEVVAGAHEIRARLDALRLTSFVKTTGGKGLHVVVPLTGQDGWDAAKAFAKSLADGMAADSPGRYLATMSKKARRGLIYVDYLRNGRGATAIAPYSTRARPGATVSVPLRWEEASDALQPARLTVESVPSRLARLADDPWKEIGAVRQSLPGLKRTIRPRVRKQS